MEILHIDTNMYYNAVAFDVETPNCCGNAICSIGITEIIQGKAAESREIRINPDTYFDNFCISVHGITPDMVSGAPEFYEVWPEINQAFGQRLVLAHNARFDLGVLKKVMFRYGLYRENIIYCDTLAMARRYLKNKVGNNKLGTLCDYYKIDLDPHRAGSDSAGCAGIYLKMLKEYGEPSDLVRMFEL